MIHLRHAVIGTAVLIATAVTLGGEVEIVASLAPKYKARAEVRLRDGTRCDLLTSEYAIEVDWASKQYEAWGQATYYAELTSRKPGVVLLTKDRRKDARHLKRAEIIGKRLNIRLWVEDVQD